MVAHQDLKVETVEKIDDVRKWLNKQKDIKFANHKCVEILDGLIKDKIDKGKLEKLIDAIDDEEKFMKLV